MVSPLFQPKISNLQSQIAELHARIERLNQVQLVADGAIEAVKTAMLQVGEVEPDEIVSFKAALNALFNIDGGGDQGEGKGDGGQPLNPAPTPAPTSGDSINPDSTLKGDYCQIDLETYWITAQPDGSSSSLATPIACQMEDCPAESLLGQAVKIACLLGHHDILCEGEVLEAPAGYQ